MKKYTFKCPHCGSKNVECVMTVRQYCAVEFEEDGWPLAGDVMDESFTSQPEWRCADCYHEFAQDEIRDIVLNNNQK